MNGSGRKSFTGFLPLLLVLAACTDPVVVPEDPDSVETCEWLIPVGIELVNDYVYTLAETDLGAAAGDPGLLPTSIIALNERGQELDRRAAELECDLEELNQAIVDATEGIESTDPVVRVFLETVRGGVVGPITPIGSWLFIEGEASGIDIGPVADFPITLVLATDGLVGDAGCNDYLSRVDFGDGSWTTSGITRSAVTCLDEGVTEAEDLYLDALAAVVGFSVDGDALLLEGPDVALRYARVDP